MTYGIISDIHSHDWSTMSSINEDGVNTRLAATLKEIDRAADTIVKAKGRVLVVDGDLFHSRGKLDPEVFNLTHDTFVGILKRHPELEIVGIPGNHDLKSDDTKELSNAFRSFAAIDPNRITIFYQADSIVFDRGPRLAFVPWRKRHEDLIADVERLADRLGAHIDEFDLHMHVGFDGTLSTMPDHGMTSDFFVAYGFRNVFSGHYHHFKDFGNRGYSVGALTHQTWGDVGTRAGFVLVKGDGSVEHRASHAPNFVDVTDLDPADMALECDGNFVRFRGENLKESEINQLRDFFKKSGAVGVHMAVTKEKPSARGTKVQTSTTTLNQSVASYVDHAFKERPADRVAAIQARAGAILKDVQSLSGAAA
ncbi:metallophosphoesterase [Aureimonas sp. AU40]|uniref:metallophosphoesterase n=1 Tax=Aureimonas sp. AU40 TaxID=1637747 RepID=UPI0007829D33|nr:metallophosphoesterase [Aureimonas sp. AU40]